MKTSSPHKNIRLRLALFSSAVATLSLGQSAFAASAVWTGTAGDGLFATGGNWSTGAAPGSLTVINNADTATFNIATGAAVTVDTGRNLQNFTFDTAVGSFTFNGGSLLLTTGGTTQLASTVTSTGQAETFNTPITIEGAAYTFSNNATTSDILSLGAIGAGVTGGGVSGTVKTALTLTFNGANTSANAVTGAITQFDAFNLTAVTKSGAGSWLFTGASNYAGATTINGGILQFSGANGANTGVSAYTVNAGGSLVLNNTAAAGGNNANRIADTSTVALNGGSFIYNGAGTDAGTTNSTETIGAITAGLGGNSMVTVNAGGANTATLTGASFVRAVGTGVGAVLINGTGLGSSTTAANKFLLTAAPAILIGTTAPTNSINAAAKNTRIVPFLLGEATATTGGLGTATGTANTFLTYAAGSGFRPLNLTDEFTNNAITATNNTYLTTGTTASTTTVSINSLIINGGALTVADGTTLTNASGALLFSGNGSIQPSGTTGIYAPSATGTNTGSEHQITVNSGFTGTIGAVVAGGNGLTKNGAGTLVLSGANTYTGKTDVIAGTLQLASGSILSTGSSANALNVYNSAVLDLHDANVAAISSTTNAGSTITNNGAGTSTFTPDNGTVQGGIQLAGLITDGTNGGKVALVLNDNNGAGAFAPDQLLNTANTYSGGTSVYGQHALRYAAGGFGTGTVTFYAGSEPDTTTAGTTPSNLVFSNTNSVNPGLVGTNILFGTDAAQTFTGSVTGNAVVQIQGNAVGTFTGDLSGFTGTFDFEAKLGMNFTTTNLAQAGLAINSTSAAVQYTGTAGTTAAPLTTTVQIGSLAGTAAGILENSSANNTVTFQVGALNTNTSFAGIIKGNGTNAFAALQKVGTGTLTLTGTNTYTGPTTVTAGALLVNNATPATTSGTGTGAVNVNGGTFGGVGSSTGLLTLAAGANLSPGATNVSGDIGTFSARGGVALNGTYVVDLGTTTTDLTAVTGALTLNSTSSALNVRSLVSGAATGTVYEILTSSTVLSTTFAGLANGSTYTDAAGDTFTVKYNDLTNTTVLGDVSLTLNSFGGTAVPEPSTYVGGLLMMGVLGWQYRRSLRRGNCPAA